MFSIGSDSSISFATDTPSLVMVGAPNFLSMMTFRPFGPKVTFTASANASTPFLRRSLASVSKNAMTVVERLGIAGLLDDIVDAAAITHGKPHPEIFLTAAAHLGTPPACCLGVEDAIAGVRAIKAAGMTALGVGDPAVLTEADAVISGLHQFTLDVAERQAR